MGNDLNAKMPGEENQKLHQLDLRMYARCG